MPVPAGAGGGEAPPGLRAATATTGAILRRGWKSPRAKSG
ncbi:hypothetical protein SAM23877_5537 [Streptomyces ambofaciens ATCC 23877]|uniref:Uncharacterized protein n=1 Tax=Streptomyces ambofaciens (strain ATCC 23877 / 3486 / DSM 40053 / JCM 4204 / NBRC 12836 / NRRL B-2516) TaxID=278992 RepID=A0A0K2B0H3_STRA7|nr:hypothetical protein SAM23877_5537 [Streptomyces ambofaciens ATCC 23877]